MDKALSDPVIIWFRNDLRLSDHPALAAAVSSGRPVIPVYILDEQRETAPGNASRWWLHHSLASLNKSLEKRGGKLLLRRGASQTIIEEIIHTSGAKAVYFSRHHDPQSANLEENIHSLAMQLDIDCRRFKGQLLYQPERVKTQQGLPYKVFTPFWRACQKLPAPSQPMEAPKTIAFAQHSLKSDQLDDWGLLPKNPDWAVQFSNYWKPGEDKAQQRLHDFIDGGLSNYIEYRDYPDIDATSGLSAHLQFGEISPRQIWHMLDQASVIKPELNSQAQGFIRQLFWRDFSYYLLHYWPDITEQPFKPEFANFPWTENKRHLRAWQKGQTGFPIVDAGMRQLWATGWMHNRVRMIVASFLIKDLLIHWQEGGRWFWDTLVDADIANNTASWQWVAGSGADAAPYFRIFNPTTQSQKFDKSGAYIRRWVPELSALPEKYIHAPEQAPVEVLKEADLTLGKDYPFPMVNHAECRQRALALYKELKN